MLETRTTQIPTVQWATICGYEVLEQTRWLGSSLPIVRVTGEERLTEDGHLNYTGVVRHAKDPQYAYNLWTSRRGRSHRARPQIPLGPRGRAAGRLRAPVGHLQHA